MLTILPLASAFHAEAHLKASLDALSQNLNRHGINHRLVRENDDTPSALLLLTGGTEHRALSALESMEGPALLLAHPEQNSLPAAMEILGRLRQEGRSGRIVLLNAAEDGYQELRLV
ncbi:MAG TPA: hypothetical protein PLI21_07140, partial [Methanomassiliicoccaceae archaeon]|nr:hypothetical protein [Methanomassiliicoccaceae archaeon]